MPSDVHPAVTVTSEVLTLPEAQEESTGEALARLDERFRAGMLNGAQSTALAQAVASGLALAPDDTLVDDVRCQGSLCRIRARHDNPQAQQVFTHLLSQRLESGRQTLAVLHPEDDEGRPTVYYLDQSEAE